MTSVLRDMTLTDVKDVLGRALIDSDFRENLVTNPREVLSVLGYTASQESLNYFSALGGGSFPAAGNEVENRRGGPQLVCLAGR
jgi:hypothetical protein